jgi:hypothetical protein
VSISLGDGPKEGRQQSLLETCGAIPTPLSISLHWRLSNRADPEARVLADRHYNRQKIGAAQFVPPGRCLVLLSIDKRAFWVTSWPFAEYVKHAWAGAWMCSAFRNESPAQSSAMIRDAVAITRWKYGVPPAQGFVTFVDRDKTKPKKHPGYCYQRAGFLPVGLTKAGLVALQLLTDDMPAPMAPAA